MLENYRQEDLENNGEPFVKTITVTPALAQKWLNRNRDYQRPISDKSVNQLYGTMLRGEWQVTPTDSIGLATDGSVIEGQHRLLALIRYGKPLNMSVAYNVPLSNFPVLGRSRTRSTSQIAGMAKLKYAKPWHIAAVNVLRWQPDSLQSLGQNWLVQDSLYLLKHYEEELSIAFPPDHSGATQFRLAPFRGAVLRVAIARPDCHQRLYDFVRIVAAGIPLEDADIPMMLPFMLRVALGARQAIRSEDDEGVKEDKKTRNVGREFRFKEYRSCLTALKHFVAGTSIRNQSTISSPSLKKQPFPIFLDKIPSHLKAEEYLATELRQQSFDG